MRREILPRARKDNRLPPEIYANNLLNFGVKTEPQQLIDRALVGFQQTRDEMQTLSRMIAKERGLPSADYHDVLRALKAQKIPNDQLMPIIARGWPRSKTSCARKKSSRCLNERP